MVGDGDHEIAKHRGHLVGLLLATLVIHAIPIEHVQPQTVPLVDYNYNNLYQHHQANEKGEGVGQIPITNLNLATERHEG